jgi:hypothetical protein
MVRPTMAEPKDEVADEFGRRLAAARGYTRTDAKTWAEKVLGKDRGTLRRYEAGKVDPLKRAGLIDLYVDKTKLPKEFFSIDLNKLPEMVAAWRRVRDEAATPAAMIEAQERDEAEILPPDPSAPQSEGQEP